jgi:tRNA G18 (ribose-2'-O)-methylase SpoU
MTVRSPAAIAGYAIRECTEAACRFRFPTTEPATVTDLCPWCGGRTVIVCALPAATEQRVDPPTPPAAIQPMAALLDNVRSTFNVGSIFRSADGAGVHHLFLCGVTPTPEHRKIAKTALGAEDHVAWSHHRNAVLLAETLRTNGYTLWALETSDTALSLFEIEASPQPQPLVLVVGSEATGIDPALLALCDRCIAIPMAGQKRSLNVATAFGVAAVILHHRLQSVRAVASPPSTGG